MTIILDTISVSDSIWKWVSDLGQLDDDSKENLEIWRRGSKKPTYNQLDKFSKKTRIPIGYFFLDTPPTEKIKLLEFRTVDSLSLQNPSRDLIDTIRQMEYIQDWMREYVVTSNGEKVQYVGSMINHQEVLSFASILRNILSLPINWFEKSRNSEDSIKIFRQAISNIGILVMMNGVVGLNNSRTLNVEEFRAFTLIDDFAPLIFLNARDLKPAILFSLVHEFTHIGLGNSSFFNASPSDSNFVNPIEVLCNAVTAEILVPKSIFIDRWLNESSELDIKIENLASRFTCSQSVIARRAFDCGFITQNEYNSQISHGKKVVKKKPINDGGNFYNTLATRIDHNFLHALNESVNEGKTLYTEAFRLTHTNRSTFKVIIEKVQGS